MIFNRKNNIYVLLNPRLKTIDTIIPILMELDKKKVNVIIYSPDELTTKSIKENVVINDCVNKVGKLIYFNRRNSVLNKIFRFFWILKILFFISFNLFFNKVDFIYFSELKGKKKFLKLFRYNVFLFENDPYGHTKFIEFTKKIEREKLQGIKIKSSSFKLPKQNLVLFTNNFYNLEKNMYNKNVSFWSYTQPKLSTKWLNFVMSNQKIYFENEFKNNNLPVHEKIISISLGIFNKDFGWDKSGKIMETLLEECLIEILNLKLDLPIFLKPYPISSKGKDIKNMETLKKILNKVKYDKYIISNLHPMILAQKSLFMIANSNTANFADFKYFNVPSIEYTHYSKELLKLSGHKSIRPDWATYFINHDKTKLKKCLKEIVYKNKNEIFQLSSKKNKNNLLINRLNGNKKLYLQSYNEVSKYLN